MLRGNGLAVVACVQATVAIDRMEANVKCAIQHAEQKAIE